MTMPQPKNGGDASDGRPAAAPSAEPSDGVAARPKIWGPALVGMLVVGLFFGVFGSWAALAPLESGAIAPGAVIFDLNRKTIQHLEGGIVGEILVRDGDEVKAGEVLIRLDETQPRAALELLRLRRMDMAALAARLRAERDGLDEVAFPDWLTEIAADSKVAEMLSGQVNIFDARRESISTQIAVLNRRVAQFSEEIKGLKGEIKAENKQLELIAEEVADLAKLFAKGLVPKRRLLELQREAADIEGERSRNVSSIARAKQSISETELHMIEIETSMMSEVVQELRDVQGEMFDLAERIRAAEDVISRTEVRAPLDGTIVNLQIHSPRGVIGPGESLLDIVPRDDRLVVEAKVKPADIDIVHPGLAAHVRLTAFNSRSVRPVDGKVTSVSADSITDERTGEAYYPVRVELTGDVSKALEGAALYPGMPAEVMFVNAARTPLDYAIRPVTRSLERAFREE